MYRGKFYYEDGSFKLIDSDTIKTLKKFETKTFDMIFADPPYCLLYTSPSPRDCS